MWIIIILSILWLLLHGLVVIRGTYFSAGIGEVPYGYQSQIVQFVLNIAFFLWLALAVAIAILNWKVFLGLFLGGCFFGKLLLWPISERLLMFPLFAWLEQKVSEYEDEEVPH
jgi:hypothetical protein